MPCYISITTMSSHHTKAAQLQLLTACQLWIYRRQQHTPALVAFTSSASFVQCPSSDNKHVSVVHADKMVLDEGYMLQPKEACLW